MRSPCAYLAYPVQVCYKVSFFTFAGGLWDFYIESNKRIFRRRFRKKPTKKNGSYLFRFSADAGEVLHLR